MERLTQKHDVFDYVLPEQNTVGDNQAIEISLGETEYTCKKYIIGEAIKKLGELEDVLEKYGIDNLDDFMKEYSSRNIKLANDNYVIEQEIADLQHRLKVAEKALELAVKDKCKFENSLLSTSLGITGGKVAVPKKEQYYIEQAKEMLENE